MSTELTYLSWAALLTGSLWIPYVIAQVTTNGFLTPANYVDPTPRPLPPWGQRANRAHLNAVESFAPFAALIGVVHVTGAESSMTAIWAAIYFWARLIHAVVYLLGTPYVRTGAFNFTWFAILGLFWAVIS